MRTLNRKLNAGATIVKALCGKWISVNDLSEILRIPPKMVYQELCQLSRVNGAYILLLRDGSAEPRLLILPTKEWENLLHYISLLPKAA